MVEAKPIRAHRSVGRLAKGRPARGRLRFATASLVLAAIASGIAAAATGATQKTAAAKPASRDPELERQLAAQDAEGVLEVLPRLIAAKERAARRDTLQLVADLNAIGAQLYDMAAVPAIAAAAESLFVRALHLREAKLGPDHVDVAKSCNMLGIFLSALGQYERSAPYFERALTIREAKLPPGDADLAFTQRSFGELKLAQGEYRAAEPLLEAALASYAAPPIADSTGLVAVLTALGELRRTSTRFAEAESCFQRALGIGTGCLPPGDTQIAAVLNNLAGVYKDQARYDAAEPLLQRSLEIRSRAVPRDESSLATAWLNLAELHRLQDRPALAEYDTALALARRALDPGNPEIAWFLNQKAAAHVAEGEPVQAAPLYENSRAILERAGGPAPLMAQTDNDLAIVRAATGHPAAAESLYRRALLVREGLYGTGHPEAALTRIDLAGFLESQGRAAEAETLLEPALQTLDATHAEPEACIAAHYAEARLLARRDAPEKAVTEAIAAIDRIDALRPHRGGGESSRVRFLAGRDDLFDDAVDWSLRTGDVARALEIADRGRGRAFLDRLAASSLDPFAEIPAEKAAVLQANLAAAQLHLGEVQEQLRLASMSPDLPADERHTRIAALERDSDAAAVELGRAHDAILAANPRWQSVLAERAVVPADSIARLLPKHGMLLFYQTGRDACHLMVVEPPPRRPRAFRLDASAAAARELGITAGPITGPTLDRLLLGVDAQPPRIDLSRTTLVVAQRGVALPEPLPGQDVDAAARRLHALFEVLVPEELWKQIDDRDDVVLVPDGALHRLPFEALVVGEPQPRKRPRTWLDAGPVIRYAISGASLARLARRHDIADLAATPVALSVSDPNYGSASGAPRLPGTARESAAIVAALGSDRVQVLSGAAATEPGVRAALPGKRWVHLATHGLVNREQSELRAALLFAPPDRPGTDHEADGLLQLVEIDALALDCDLAVLSACETSAGAYVQGEGVYALSRGFLAAGARRVVASLWPVEDRSTAALMEAFFQRIAAEDRRGKGVDYARALRDAKRSVRSHAEWSAPYYWAPFVLTGLR